MYKRMTLDDLKKDDKKKLPQPKEKEVMFHWFANGFMINDEPFQDASIPENAELLKKMESGKVPRELIKRYPEAENFVLDDRKKEVYRPPTPPKLQKFQGTGISLQDGSVAGHKNPYEMEESKEQLPINVKAGKIKFDANKESGQIQFIFHNGDKASVQVNSTTKISELFDYVMQVAPIDGSFQLLAGFPPKPLTNMNITVEEADVIDGRVTQKIA